MYAVKKEGVFAGYADSIVLIKLHGNGTCEKLYSVATSLPMKVGDKHGDENSKK